MKNSFLILFLCAGILFSCSENKRKQLPEKGFFGQTFSKDSSITVIDLPAIISVKDSAEVQVSGTIGKYCKGEGCWISIENPNGKPVLVETLNKSFIVPYDIDNKKVQVKGKLVRVEPDSKYSFKIIANGVLIE
jgi:uncharacterized protein YdeI (BOF family)